MAKLKIDYSEARDWYIKGDKEKEGIKYPSLPDIAREFEYSLSTLRKKAANEGWFKKREERMAISLRILLCRKEISQLHYYLVCHLLHLHKLLNNQIQCFCLLQTPFIDVLVGLCGTLSTDISQTLLCQYEEKGMNGSA